MKQFITRMSEITYQPKERQTNFITIVVCGRPFLNLFFLKIQLLKLSEQKMNAEVSRYFNLKEYVVDLLIRLYILGKRVELQSQLQHCR